MIYYFHNSYANIYNSSKLLYIRYFTKKLNNMQKIFNSYIIIIF